MARARQTPTDHPPVAVMPSATSIGSPAVRRRPVPWLTMALVLAPAALLLAGAWSHRWMNEDGFINLRIVDQVFDGNGPVFNAGERVEAYTSPLWLGVLLVARATLGQIVSAQWSAVLAGLALATAGFAVAGLATRRLHDDDQVALPVGLLAVAAVPVVWDFATAGLEMSLVYLWLGSCWLALLSAARRRVPATGRWRAVALAVLGLGPLVRPDLGVMTVCFLVAWAFIVRPTGKRLVGDVATALALPVAYQVFRMGYFAALVPTTALAKDAGGTHLGQGVDYLTDLLGSYWLWLVLLLLAVAVAVNLVRRPRPLALACWAFLAAGVLHAAYIVLVGGDYMHGRLLLPALLAVALPASVGVRPARRDAPALVLSGAVAVWAVFCAATLRYEQPAVNLFEVVLSDWRQLAGPPYVEPVEDDGAWLSGNELRALEARGEDGLVRTLGSTVLATEGDQRLVWVQGSIGLPAFNAGTGVHVVDIGGLAEPLAARTEAVPGSVPGHRKVVAPEWYEARFRVSPDSPRRTGEGALVTTIDPGKVAAARRALTCRPLEELLDAVTAPLTPGRFLSNLWRSVGVTRLVVAADPVEAETELCD